MTLSVTKAAIDAATDALTLQKLQATIELENAQAYQDELANVAAYRVAESKANADHRAKVEANQTAIAVASTRAADVAEKNLVLFRQQATGFDASERGEVMRRAFETLLASAVKPSTATTRAGKETDANADAEWLELEVAAVMRVYDALRGATPPA